MERPMCRATSDAKYRRCPYHSNPKVMALASAKQAADRMAKRLEAAEDNLSDDELQTCVNRLTDAYQRVHDRTQATPETLSPATPAGDGPPPEPLGTPTPSAADAITADRVEAMSWGELANLASDVWNDPEAANKLETLIEEKEAKEQQSNEWATGAAPQINDDPISNPASRPQRKLTPHERAREEYDNYVYSQYLNMQNELSFTLNEEGKRKGIDDFSLFSGPVSRAKKYGSEELQSWFARNGRHTLSSFRHGLFGWSSDAKAAKNVSLEGFEHVAHVG